MVLAVPWLESLGPILWDFGWHTITFVRNGHRVLWATLSSSPASLCTVSADLMDELLTKSGALFAEPSSQPPPHQLCHLIQLMLDTTPVVMRSYRYMHT
jgi:hypothetical protein